MVNVLVKLLNSKVWIIGGMVVNIDLILGM